MLPSGTRLNGRIMIVSDRAEVVAELEPMLRASHHLPVSVADGREALRMLRDGVVPDLLISDLESDRSLEQMEYVWRFRALNRVGSHLAIVEDGAPFSRRELAKGRHGGATMPLRRPFHPDEVSETVEAAIRRMDGDIRSLRSEVWRELDQLRQAVRDVRHETVSALAATIAVRDPYMHGHATRVAALCRQVGELLRLDEEDAPALETAALLHEIGKASVPMELLHKAGPLSPEELGRIRAHAAAGAEIVRRVPSLGRVASLIEHQGTDYTDLARHFANAAPDLLLAGVLRVADAYDAMTHARAYRGAMPQDYSQGILERGAGTTFHPQAVRALLRLVVRTSVGDARAA